MATKPMRRINIIGHQNPDTDSICSALAYAWLKNRGSLEGLYEARRAGHINRETRFVLQHFGVEPPRLCTDVSPQIKDIDIRKQAGIDGEMSVRAAWNLMRDVEIDTLCIVDNEGELQGLITIKDIADANMDLFDTAVLAAASTRYSNLLETLEAELVVGNADTRIDSGNICIGTSPEIMEELVKPDDLVLVSNRYEAQMCAIDCGARAIIVCCGSAVPRTIVARAQEKGCAILATPYDTYAAARVLSTASSEAPADSGGPQRTPAGCGRPRRSRYSGDHRPSPHRQFGDYRAGLLPQCAGGLHSHHFVPDVRRAGHDPLERDRGPAAVGYFVRHADVPLPHLDPAG